MREALPHKYMKSINVTNAGIVMAFIFIVLQWTVFFVYLKDVPYAPLILVVLCCLTAFLTYNIVIALLMRKLGKTISAVIRDERTSITTKGNIVHAFLLECDGAEGRFTTRYKLIVRRSMSNPSGESPYSVGQQVCLTVMWIYMSLRTNYEE